MRAQLMTLQAEMRDLEAEVERLQRLIGPGALVDPEPIPMGRSVTHGGPGWNMVWSRRGILVTMPGENQWLDPEEARNLAGTILEAAAQIEASEHVPALLSHDLSLARVSIEGSRFTAG